MINIILSELTIYLLINSYHFVGVEEETQLISIEIFDSKGNHINHSPPDTPAKLKKTSSFFLFCYNICHIKKVTIMGKNPL